MRRRPQTATVAMRTWGSAGVTLVEALVAMALMAILAGVIYTVLTMHGRETDESTARMLLQMKYESVIDEIGNQVRGAFLVLPTSESGSSSRPARPVLSSQNQVNLWRKDGTTIVSYRIDRSGNPDVIKVAQGNGGTGWLSAASFTGGGGTPVEVDDNPTSDPALDSYFTIHRNRAGLDVRLVLATTYRGREYILKTRGDSFRCRPE